MAVWPGKSKRFSGFSLLSAMFPQKYSRDSGSGTLQTGVFRPVQPPGIFRLPSLPKSSKIQEVSRKVRSVVKTSLTRQERRHARLVDEKQLRAEKKRRSITAQKVGRAIKRREQVIPTASWGKALFRTFGGPLVQLYHVCKRL
jgi:hypothetical protein